ncbi:MAG: DUF3810 domain-containing protein [Saprospiraceae bacterium]|nr:DUF3810 domain-containing protein [Saprospiraceae bacterium]
MTVLSLFDAKTRYRLLWVALGTGAMILARICADRPDLAEQFYGHGLFRIVRHAYDYTLGWLPWPSVWLIMLLALWRLWRTALRPLIRRRVSLRSCLLGVLSTAGAVVFLFYFLWGFNYSRADVAARLDLDARPLDAEELRAEFGRATTDLRALLAEHDAEISASLDVLPAGLEARVRTLTEQTASQLGFPAYGRVRGRLLAPRGILLVFNTAGVYVPFSGEGHVDAGMLPMQIPFTMSHEMSHALGVTDEGDCNFLAYLSCTTADDPMIRYSGMLSYWRYAASEYRRWFPDDYAEVYETLPATMRTSLAAIRANLDKYPEFMPRLRNKVYDSYLKSHGVHEGLRSYSRIVRMVRAHREANGPAD